jgi:hypothetical protein
LRRVRRITEELLGSGAAVAVRGRRRNRTGIFGASAPVLERSGPVTPVG